MSNVFSMLKIFLFWLVVFFINRLVFILYFFSDFSSIPFSEILATFRKGLPLDISMASYVMIIPVLMYLIQQLIPYPFLKRTLFIYTVILLVLNSFISVFDLAIYRDWQSKLNYRAFHYLKYAGEGAGFTRISDDAVLLFIMLIQVGIGVYLYLRWTRPAIFYFPVQRRDVLAGVIVNLIMLPLLFLGIRGGWQLIPINESSAYFSNHQIVNDAAVNTLWNAGKKMMEGSDALAKNPYRVMPEEKAREIVQRLYTPRQDSTVHVLTTTRPNVVLFILESFTSDIIEALGGEKNVTPNLDTIIRNGILFTSIYSQGFRTDQGLAAIISAFPAQPDFSIIMQPEKSRKLNFLSKVLAHNGYHNSFYYGGELGFANMKSFLLDAGFTHLTEKNTFSANEMNAKWGAHDGFVFKKQANEMQMENQPFFSVLLSLSSHEPFEVPMAPRFNGDDIASKFKNAAAYTDQSIGEYFQAIRNEPWYRNTLFIFVADHGHIEPRGRNPKEPARFHIPLIFYGDVIKGEFRGTKISNPGMQTDIAATLLRQMNLPAKQFQWSNDLLNPFRNNFAYYTSDDAYGWINDMGFMEYNLRTNKFEHSDFDVKEFNEGQAYLQELFEEYIDF